MTEFSPRKKPQQERSRRTYEGIVETASEMLVEVGYHNLSTNKIADRADVSVGSIYQYFPNKEAIVLAVIEQFAERQYEILATGLEGIEGMELEQSVRKIVGKLLQAKREAPELSRVLFEQLPPVGQFDIVHEWSERAIELIASTLESRDEDFEPDDLEMSASLVVNFAHAIVNDAVPNRNEDLKTSQIAHETTRMILRYLNP